jgi:hypothetical protein
LVEVDEKGRLVLNCQGELRSFMSGELELYKRLRGTSK